MGTYTTNYNLFMPTVGEQGWGDLVNVNFTIIDTTMKGFDDVLSKMTWDGDNVTFPGKITAINISSMYLTNEHGVIGALYLSRSTTLLSTAGEATYTYKHNPISNDVTFSVYATGSGGSVHGNGQAYLKINDIIVADTGVLYGTYSNATKTYTTTLNDGDVIYAYGYSQYTSSPAKITITMSCGGYLVSSS